MKRVVTTNKYLIRMNINFDALRYTLVVPWTIYNSSAFNKIGSFSHFSLGVKTILIVPINNKSNIPIIMMQNTIAPISPLFDELRWANYKKTKISKSM